MSLKDIPITDNHMHLRRDGKGIDAAKEFQEAGGTHIFLVNLPSWNYGISLTDPSDYRTPFDKCISLSKEIEQKTELKTYPIIGVHPAELTKWTDAGKSLEETYRLMKKGLDIAKNYVENKKAIAIGEVGRPHYPVSEETMKYSNKLMKYSFRCAKEVNCPVQLHTENMDKESIVDLTKIIEEVGFEKSKVIKHFSNPLINVFKDQGIVPSILAKENNLKDSLKKGNRFLMETDYLDDSNRPGAVLGPKNVPKKTKWLFKKDIATEEDLYNIHKELPEEIYGINYEN